jgi:hypothetical protein
VLLANAEDLNSCHELCAKITIVKICVASFVHLHLCFVKLHLLLVSMLVELSYAFIGQGDHQNVCHSAMTWE